MMPGRSYSATNGYRYGFNGKENDNEVKGEGDEQDYGMRIYDTRLGRFLSVDPLTKKYPELTPYQFASNSPTANIDIDGLERGNAISTGVSNGVNRYVEAKRQQAEGVSRFFRSWEPYKCKRR
jgi:RHS repeat-associated protein